MRIILYSSECVIDLQYFFYLQYTSIVYDLQYSKICTYRILIYFVQLMAHYIVSISCLSVCGICFGYSLAGLSICREGDPQCGINHYQEEILNIIAMCVALFMFVTALVGSIFFCVYKRLFGLYSMRELLYQAKIADLEGRVKSLETSNNPEQQRFGGQYGGQYSYNSFSSPTAPPPAYSK